MELCIVDGNSSNLLRFNLPVLSRDGRVTVAYTLMDGGASHKFVKPSVVAAIEAAGVKLEKRRRGYMELTSAGKVEHLPRVQVKLTLAFGRLQYSGWFTLYNLAKYDVILGKDWMEEVKHTIDHSTNLLTIEHEGKTIRLRGLARGVEREGEVATETEEDGVQLMVVEQVIGHIDPPGKRDYHNHPDPTPVTACRELHSLRRTQPVSTRTRRLASLEPPMSIEELFNAELNATDAATP
jgi:hypothetical protein